MPASVAAPPTAAPTSTPSAPKGTSAPKPAAGAAPSAPAPAPVPARSGERSSFFEDEDRIPDAVENAPEVPDKHPSGAPASPAKAKDAAPDKDALDKAGETPVEDALADAHKDADQEPVYRTNRELKRAYEANKKALKATEARAAELEARVAELDGVASTARKDTGPLAEQLAAAQKKIDEYEGRLRLKAYEESDEFKAKHLAPFKRSEARAFNDVKQLEYIEGVDETTGETRVRAATENDFIELYNLPTGKAYAFAKRVFGDSAQLVMNHYHALHTAQEDMREAIAEYRTRGAEQEQETQARTAQEREAGERMWRTANQDLQAKYFKELGVDPEDAETRETLTKSYATVDRMFSANGNLTMAERVGLQASVRQRAALFGMTRKQLLKAQAELKEARAEIEELRGSAPGKPKPKADAAPVGEPSSLAEDMAAYQMET